MQDTLPFEDLEKTYDLLAAAIDRVGKDKETLFLTKLAVVLAHETGDVSVVESAITRALAES